MIDLEIVVVFVAHWPEVELEVFERLAGR